MTVGRRSAHILALLVLAGMPSVTAVTVYRIDATIDGKGPAQIFGNGTGTIDASFLAPINPDPTNLVLRLNETNGRLRVLQYEYTYYVIGGVPGPLPGFIGTVKGNHTDLINETGFTGTITTSDTETSHVFRVFPHTQGSLLSTALDGHYSARWGIPGDFSLPEDRLAGTDTRFVADRLSENYTNWDLKGRGVVLNPSQIPDIEVQDAVVAIYGANVTIQESSGTRIIHAGRSEKTDQTAKGPPGTAQLVTEDYVVVLFEGGANVHTEGPAWGLLARTFTANITADLAFQQADTDYTVNGTSYHREAGLFQTQGHYRVTGNFSGATAAWALSGNGTFIGIDAVTVVGVRAAIFPLGLVTTAVIGASAAVWIAVVLLRNVADPFAGEKRQRIIELITINPGISSERLLEETGLSQTGLSFQLGILKKNLVVLDKKVPGAKGITYALNSRSFEFQATTKLARQPNLLQQGWTTGSTQVNAHVAMAMLNDARRGAIIHAIQSGCRTRRDVEAHDAKQGRTPVTQQLFARWTKELVDAGILMQRTAGRATEYDTNVLYDELLKHQAKALLVIKNTSTDYLAPFLNGATLTKRELEAHLLSKGKTRLARGVPRAIAELLAGGYLGIDVGNGKYVATQIARNLTPPTSL